VSRSLRLAHRLATVAGVAGLAVLTVACGDDDGSRAAPPGGSSSEVDAGDVPTTGSGGLPIIRMAAGGQHPGGDAAESTAMATDMRMAALRYVLDGDLPALDGPAAAWRYPARPAVDEATVRALAERFGVAGEPVALDEDQGGGWRVGPEDGSGPSLTVAADPMASWWYDSAASSGVIGGCEAADGPDAPDAPVADDDATVGGDAAVSCTPVAPEGVPDAAAAEALARAHFEQLGLSADRYELEVYADEFGANVQAVVLLDGIRSPAVASVAYGGQAAMTWASGMLAEPERGPDYPRIGTEAGFERLQAQAERWRTLELPTTGPAETRPADAVAERGAGEPFEVRLTGVRPELQLVPTVDGELWLVPAYGFTSDDGGVHTVAAIPDEYLVEEPVDSAGADAGATRPSGGEVTDEQAARLVGLTEDEARRLAEEQGWTARVVERDGEQFPVTEDHNPRRVNLVVQEGTVTTVTVG